MHDDEPSGPRRASTRWEWEQALRADRSVPWHVKSFLLLIGTYMDGSGDNATPSAARLAVECKRSRQRVFELLKEAEASGWIRTEGQNGKKKKRVPYIPDPSDRSYGSEAEPGDLTRQTGLTGGADPSDGTRQTHQTRPEQDHNRTRTTGGAPPPDPRRTDAPQAAPRTDPDPDPDVDPDPTTKVDQSSPEPSARGAKVIQLRRKRSAS